MASRRGETEDARDGALRLHLARLTPLQRSRTVEAVGLAALAPGRDLAGLGTAGRALAAVGAADLERERRRARERGVELVHRSDPRYPPLLAELTDPPLVLWVRGRLPAPEEVPVVIVGPRRPTSYGVFASRRLASEIAGLGAVIVSGGARGVDGIAHRAALAEGRPTVAVLGCGCDVAYPPEHRGLFDEIVREGGAIVSELPCGRRPRRHEFPVRNRLLAGWSPAVVVTEATARSGTLITARLALEAGREVLAVPGPITSAASEGTNELLARGARLVRHAGDVLAELDAGARERLLGARPEAAGRRSAKAVRSAPSSAAGAVLRALPKGRAASLDELLVATGASVPDLLAHLGELEAKGHVQAMSGGVWSLR